MKRKQPTLSIFVIITGKRLYFDYMLINVYLPDRFNSLSINRLLGKERYHELNPEQQVFARDDDNGLSLLEVVKKYKPTILLGVTAVGGMIVPKNNALCKGVFHSHTLSIIPF